MCLKLVRTANNAHCRLEIGDCMAMSGDKTNIRADSKNKDFTFVYCTFLDFSDLPDITDEYDNILISVSCLKRRILLSA